MKKLLYLYILLILLFIIKNCKILVNYFINDNAIINYFNLSYIITRGSGNVDRYDKALRKIKEAEKCKINCCCCPMVGQTGPTG